MSGRFVRASKYRHVFGQPTKREQCYDNLRISKNAWDTNLIKANPHYLSVNWEASGGGAFAVIPINERGKLPDQMPLFRGHTAAVLDTDWNPFDDNLIASGSDDGKVLLWKVPDGFTLRSEDDDIQDVTPYGKLTGHSRKVGHVLFNPSAANILASSSGDYTIKLWDVERESAHLTLKHGDIVQSLSWSANGSLLVTTCRDKKLRVWDVRQEKPAQEVPGHPGAKGSRAVWLGEHDRVATTGFSRMSDRQLGLWDIRAPQEPMGGFQILDSISGVCMPFWDDGTNMLYLAGKGDGNIRYYEYENDKFEYLSEYKSADAQRGFAFIPKRGVNVHEHEVMRGFKTVNDSFIEPISFIVPRRAEVFQGDIYPPTVGIKPGVSAQDWLGGQDGLPPKISLESIFDGKAPEDVPAESRPTKAATQPAPKAEPAAPKPTPTQAAPVQTQTIRSPPPKMEDNKESIAAMANKFVDNDEEEEADDASASSFEEIAPPPQRPTAARQEEKTRGPEINKAPTAKAEPTREAEVTKPIESTPKAEPAPTSAAATPAAPRPSSTEPSSTSSSAPAPAPTTAASAAQGLRDHLEQIKGLLEQQSKAMAAQNEQITQLTSEVSVLKSLVQEGRTGAGEKDERIRQLELELEAARS